MLAILHYHASMPKQKRNNKVYSVTMPPAEHDEAEARLPYGEVQTFSALVRLALKMLPKLK